MILTGMAVNLVDRLKSSAARSPLDGPDGDLADLGAGRVQLGAQQGELLLFLAQRLLQRLDLQLGQVGRGFRLLGHELGLGLGLLLGAAVGVVRGPFAGLRALANLRELFATTEHFGPVQYAGFLAQDTADEVAIDRQRAYQLVFRVLEELERLDQDKARVGGV